MPANKGGNIYGEVSSATDIREINQKIRGEMASVTQREQLTELKKRSDYLCTLAMYLCTLAMAPSWKEKFGRKSSSILRAAKDEDRKTTDRANRIAEKHGWDADYDPWGA
jgi:hypothetical protein